MLLTLYNKVHAKEITKKVDYIFHLQKKSCSEKVTSYGDLVRLNIKIVVEIYPVYNVLTTELFCIFQAKEMATIGKIGSRYRLVPGY